MFNLFILIEKEFRSIYKLKSADLELHRTLRNYRKFTGIKEKKKGRTEMCTERHIAVGGYRAEPGHWAALVRSTLKAYLEFTPPLTVAGPDPSLSDGGSHGPTRQV